MKSTASFLYPRWKSLKTENANSQCFDQADYLNQPPSLKYSPKERDGDELLPASGFQCSGIQNVEKERVRWITQNMAIVPMA